VKGLFSVQTIQDFFSNDR